jgi:hypothetical protein
MTGDWPVAGLDRIQRLRLLAAGLPGLVVEEREIAVPFDRFWGWLGDVERSVPVFEHTVGKLRIVGERDGRFDVRATVPGRIGIPIPFDVEVSEGWCWMVTRPRAYVVGMAAEPTADGQGTRYAHLEGVAPTLPRWLGRPLAWALHGVRGLQRRHVRHDIDGIVRESQQRSS